MRGTVLIAACLLTGAVLGAEQRLTKQDADRFQTKLTRIVGFGGAAPASAASAKKNQSTSLTDVEVNSYLRYSMADQIPTGIVDPVLNAMGEGRVSGRAVVDLDAVRKQKQRGWLDPMSYLTGRLPITASGRLSTKDGVGRFTLESAEISGVTVPKSLVQELLTYYSRSAERPDGINMDDPFQLPSRIREIQVGQGTATVIQ
jgi:hypothetical protein